MVTFTVPHLSAAAGVMVTASHNPPEYNGYKVYWSNGAQIIPPHDKGIAAAIAEQPPADEVKLLDLPMAREKNLLADWPQDLEPAYLAAIARLALSKGGDRSFPIVYTALHGVGNRLVLRAMEQAGFTRVKSVPEQAEPDGAFPTVRFPNPEEKGALDLAYALADREKSDLIIANDPDVDRLAVAVRGKDGRWVQLTGNEVGTLLGHYLLTEVHDPAGADGERAPSSRAPTSVQDDRLVLASCVSSPMLGAICRELGVRYEETLTGFKWIANRAMELERTRGARFVFGYEEASGTPSGRSSATRTASPRRCWWPRSRRCAGRGESLLDELAGLARKYGVYLSGQRAITLPGSDGLAKMGAVMAKLREAPPDRVGGLQVVAVSDYQAQVRREGGKSSALALPKTNMLALDLEGGSRIIARPSGTEPKIKFYFDVREQVAEGEAAAAAMARAQATLAGLAEDFVRIAGV
ncbi:MAG: phospho-sugar mutase [Polyangiaceae bacterium]